MNRKDRTQGFTLLEVVVTLAILSISLTTLYQLYSSVTRGTRVSANYYKALQLAETQIALLSAQQGIRNMTSGVVDDYYRWTTSVKPYSPPNDSPLAGNELTSAAEGYHQPYLLTVVVNWGEDRERELELSTIRLGARP